MRAFATVRSRSWRRLMSSTRRRVEVVALVMTIVAAGAVVFEMAATAGDDTVKGEPVPEGDVPAIVEAALSCPALNPPKLAAQIMATSGFKGGGEAVAGLDEAAFQKWRPSSGASRADRRANIIALGHRTCENVGHLRSAELDGDLWPAAVAAEHGGLKPVIDAHGVPKAAQSYVDQVKGYASWYAQQPPFAESAGAPSAAAGDAAQLAVPDDLVQPIQVAGGLCKEITPARIAAQLRVVSGFDVNKRAGDRQGVAQFTPAMWETYQTGAKKSVWRPADAIPALGVAMCDMTQQLSSLNGQDPYRLALAAYQWGLDTVRRADGLPRVNVRQWADQAGDRVAEYQKDSRLAVPVAKPQATPSAAPSAAPSVSPSKGAGRPTEPVEAAPADRKPSGPKLFAYDPKATYEIWSDWANQIVDVPGSNEATVEQGKRLDLWYRENADDQYWRIEPAADHRHVVITSVRTGMAIGIQARSRNENDKISVYSRDAGDDNQQWLLEDVGDGKVVMTNKNSGYVMELLGNDIGAPNDNGTTWNGYWIEQLKRDDRQKDQKWRFVKR